MSCPKETLTNPQCVACKIKGSVRGDGTGLQIDQSQSGLVRWKTKQGDPWISLPKDKQAHCPKGILIHVG
jgi:hypothetical protein